MKKINQIIGGLGIVLLIASVVWYSISKIWGTPQWILSISGIAGVIYFLIVFYQKRERSFSAGAMKKGTNVLAQVVIVLAIVGMLAFITTRRHFRADWTANNYWSLADQTTKLLEGLEKEVEVKAFFKTAEQDAARDKLDEYDYLTDKFSYEMIDPDERPEITKQYEVKSYGTLIVESGTKWETVDELSEVKLTNAIIKVTREQDKVIYFLTGHGEASIDDEGKEGFKQAVEAIKKENHLVRELNLVRRRSIPDSCSVLAVISPKTNLFPAEIDTIKAYVENGGKLLLMTDPDHPESVASLAAHFHVSVGNDLVIDASGVGQLFGAGPAMPLVTNYPENHVITGDFGNVMTFYPQASSVFPLDEKGGYNMTELLKTSGNSWAEADYAGGRVSFDEEEDTPGPVTLAVIASKDVVKGKAVAAIFGDSDFARNGYFNSQGNSNLFLNTVNFLAEEEDLISIRPREIEDRRLTMTQADVSTLLYLVVILIPVLMIIIGVVVYYRRNKAK